MSDDDAPEEVREHLNERPTQTLYKSPSAEAAASTLADLGDVLTERQATAWVLRDVEHVPRRDAADMMGVTVSSLDTTLSRARTNIREARAVLDAVDRLTDDDE